MSTVELFYSVQWLIIVSIFILAVCIGMGRMERKERNREKRR